MPGPVKNLIFDLGGVILDLSVDRSLQAFADLSGMPKRQVMDLFVSSPGFEAYEKGLITDEEFRNYVRKIYFLQASDDEIDACWNAMLAGLSPLNLDLLHRLKKSYNVFLLSNTNAIHLDYINRNMLPNGHTSISSLDDYFHRAYYSYEMKKRKPEPEIFQQVLQENTLLPEQTLFLDDNLSNIESAKTVGLQTIHVASSDFILTYFDD